jgi:uncharacterized DUF497 family protein
MKYFDWSVEKNEQLKEERGISFEEIIVAINEGNILDTLIHKNQKKYPEQKIFVVKINEYVYIVPFIEDDEKIFFKTIFPSRKATKNYIINNK